MEQKMDAKQIALKAYERRLDVVEMLYKSSAGHIGGDMSVMEILCSLYYGIMHVGPEMLKDPDRDRFILSKGHCADALYTILGDLGYFDKQELLNTFSAFGSRYIGHPNMDVPGVEANGGSLGHGLSLGVGMAIAAKMDKRPTRTYVVLGDGEMGEGSNYEAMMSAGHYHLDNLCATVDINRLQISGTTKEVMDSSDLAEKFHDFHWNVIEVSDGNDVSALLSAYHEAADYKGRPTAVIAHTVKGKGISYMEDDVTWHHGVMSPAQYEQAREEITARIVELGGAQ